MNAWTQTCTAVLENSASASTSLVTTHVNARMDCITQTTLAKVRHHIYIIFSCERKQHLWSKKYSQPFRAHTNQNTECNEPIKPIRCAIIRCGDVAGFEP